MCFFPDIRGLLVGIMEARKPDRQGRLASLLASSLPRFISYCYVAAWQGLRMSVCVFVCPVCVCSDVGQTTEDGGGHIGQSKLHILCECDSCRHPFFQSWMFSAASAQLTDQLDTFPCFTQPPQLLHLPFSPPFYLLLMMNLLELCFGFGCFDFFFPAVISRFGLLLKARIIQLIDLADWQKIPKLFCFELHNCEYLLVS